MKARCLIPCWTRRSISGGLAIAVCLASPALAAEHRIEPLDKALPADALAEPIAAQIAADGFRIVEGKSRTVLEVWLCKTWPTRADFESTGDILYPFQQGQLIGVARFARSGSDFRDQSIGRGVYTLRYAQQPVDGAHVGTSPTRDFLILAAAESDTSPEPLDIDTLIDLSCEAIDSSHPAMLCMQRVRDKAETSLAIRHNEQHDWWVARFSGKSSAGGKTSELPIDLVVVGHAEE